MTASVEVESEKGSRVLERVWRLKQDEIWMLWPRRPRSLSEN